VHGKTFARILVVRCLFLFVLEAHKSLQKITIDILNTVSELSLLTSDRTQSVL